MAGIAVSVGGLLLVVFAFSIWVLSGRAIAQLVVGFPINVLIPKAPFAVGMALIYTGTVFLETLIGASLAGVPVRYIYSRHQLPALFVYAMVLIPLFVVTPCLRWSKFRSSAMDSVDKVVSRHNAVSDVFLLLAFSVVTFMAPRVTVQPWGWCYQVTSRDTRGAEPMARKTVAGEASPGGPGRRAEADKPPAPKRAQVTEDQKAKMRELWRVGADAKHAGLADAARQAWQKALDLDPDNQSLRQAVAELGPAPPPAQPAPPAVARTAARRASVASGASTAAPVSTVGLARVLSVCLWALLAVVLAKAWCYRVVNERELPDQWHVPRQVLVDAVVTGTLLLVVWRNGVWCPSYLGMLLGVCALAGVGYFTAKDGLQRRGMDDDSPGKAWRPLVAEAYLAPSVVATVLFAAHSQGADWRAKLWCILMPITLWFWAGYVLGPFVRQVRERFNPGPPDYGHYMVWRWEIAAAGLLRLLNFATEQACFVGLPLLFYYSLANPPAWAWTATIVSLSVYALVFGISVVVCILED